MRLGITLSFAVAALLLASSGSAYADSTYTIATTTSYMGTVSGSITGTGTTLSSFDVTSVDGPNTYVFDSSAGDQGFFQADPGFATSNGTPLNILQLDDPAGDRFILTLTGDFTSGLTPLAYGQLYCYNGYPCFSFGGELTVTAAGSLLTNDDVSLTLQPNVVPTPEPSSLLLMGAGLAGLCTTRRRQRRNQTGVTAAQKWAYQRFHYSIAPRC
jgi:hypothetical protein